MTTAEIKDELKALRADMAAATAEGNLIVTSVYLGTVAYINDNRSPRGAGGGRKDRALQECRDACERAMKERQSGQEYGAVLLAIVDRYFEL